MAEFGKLITECIFRHLTEKNMFTIPEIVQDTGISITTISKYVSTMLETGILEQKDTVKTGNRGRQAILYGIKGSEMLLLGVDVKTDMLVLSFMKLSGKIVRTEFVKSFRYDNSDRNLEQLCSHIETFIAQGSGTGKVQLVQICIIIGGRVSSSRGTSASHYTVEDLDGKPLASYLEERLGFPVILENDTKAMAYAEYLDSDRTKYSDLLYINIGWGLGLGIIIDGKLYRGKDGYSGEFGHIHSYENDILCHCGKTGCLETEVSGRALSRKLTEQISMGKSSTLASKVKQAEKIGMEDIMAAAEKEDPLCLDLISKVGNELGAKLSSLINIFNPECIVIGGALSKATSYYFYYPIRAAIRKHSLRLMSKDIIVEMSKLGEEVGVLGACLLAKQQYFNKLDNDLRLRSRDIFK